MKITPILLIVVSLLSTNLFAQTDSRLKFINKLLTTSTGAKQVLKSDNQEAHSLHQKATQLFEQAQQQNELGNHEKSSALLNESAKSMFKAIRLATPKTLGKNKLKNDFIKREDAVKTLNTAFNRIADESKDCQCKEKTNNQIVAFTSTAQQLLQDGKTILARTELDKAYHLIKVSIESLRGGQTLVRSLDFASPEEEYHYEIDRNDTHNMLVKLLVKDMNLSDYTSNKVIEFTDNAKTIRTNAEISAQNNDFEEAIKMLEDSTKQLVRAIRSAGIYIPG